MPEASRPIKLEDEARQNLFDLFCESGTAAGAVSYNLFQLADAPIELGRPTRTLMAGGWEYQFQVSESTPDEDWWFHVFFRIGQAGPEETVYVSAILRRRVPRDQ